MSSNMKFLLFFFAIFSCLTLYSQQKLIDSLEFIIHNERMSDRDKIIPLARLGTAYTASTSELDKALSLIKKAASLAKQEKDAKYAAYSYSQLASLYSNLDSVLLAYATIDTCLFYLNKTEDPNIKSNALTSLARAKLIFGDYNGVLDMLLQAYDLQKDDHTGKKLSSIYYMLYVFYSSSDLDKAKEYANLSLKESLKSNEYDAMCKAWSAVGAIGHLTHEVNKEDSTIYAYRQSMQIYEEHNSVVEYSSYVVCLLNMANIFAKKKDENGSLLYPDSILHYARKAEKIALEMNDVQFTAGILPLIANVQHDQGRVKEAEQTLISGLAYLSDKKGFSSSKEYLNKLLYSLYKMKGDYKNALIHKEEEVKYQHQSNQQKYIREGLITEAQYKLKEHKRKLELSRQEADRQKTHLKGIIIGILLLVVMLFIFYQMRLKNVKQKAELRKKENEQMRLQTLIKEKELQQVESEKKALQLEKELEKERAELQALEITHLHTKLIAGISQLSQKSDTLEKIKQKIDVKKQLSREEIKDLLLEDEFADKSFEDFSQLLDNVHPGFFSKLQDHAIQKLTSLDLKYCTYILMDFSSKEIANILHVDPKTARSTKYRLKLKLNLSKEDDLNSFIRNILHT